MKKTCVLCSLLITVFCLSVAIASAASKAQYNWTFGGAMKTQNPAADGMMLFKDLVEKYTNGRVTMGRLTFDGEICSQKGCVDQLDLKAIEIAELSVANYGAFSNILLFSEMPYLWDSVEDQGRIVDSFMDKVRQKFEKQDKRKLLTIMGGGGFRHIWTTTLVRKPSDLQGRKIRATFSPVENECIKAWGAAATPVPWGELYQSLQSKLIDGHMLQVTTCSEYNAYEATPYCTEIGYVVGGELYLMNLEYFNTLPDDIQKAVLRAATEARKYSYTRSGIRDKEHREKLLKKGVKFYRPTADEMKQWKEMTLKVWPKLRKLCDEDFLDIAIKAQGKTFPK